MFIISATNSILLNSIHNRNHSIISTHFNVKCDYISVHNTLIIEEWI